MCTVTYVPTANNEFIFTSNRDETPRRSAIEIVNTQRRGKELLFPQDPLARGTWIAVSNTNQLVCILNGAFVKHKHRPPYRLSRGVMALDFFTYEGASEFFQNYNFDGIEPFTMIIFDDGKLYELRWDEVQKHVKTLAIDKSYLWASCTLYPEIWQAKRQGWFKDWELKTKNIDQLGILDFHKNAGEGNPEYDVVMNRHNLVRTTSITSILKNQDSMHLRFENLLNRAVRQEKVDLVKNG